MLNQKRIIVRQPCSLEWEFRTTRTGDFFVPMRWILLFEFGFINIWSLTISLMKGKLSPMTDFKLSLSCFFFWKLFLLSDISAFLYWLIFALPQKETLYVPTEDNDPVVHRHVGRQIYETFNMVVLLKEQKRVYDEVWYQFLWCLRNGNITKEDISMLWSLVLSPSNTINFNETPWRDAFLLTPRHTVCTQWNKKAVQKTCEQEKQQLCC